MQTFLQFLAEATAPKPPTEVEVTDEWLAWWNSAEMDVANQTDVGKIIERLIEEGTALGFPHSSGIKTSRHGGMRELRMNNRGRAIRVFYIFDPRRVALLLTGGNKVGRSRFYEEMVPAADSIYDQHLREIGR